MSGVKSLPNESMRQRYGMINIATSSLLKLRVSQLLEEYEITLPQTMKKDVVVDQLAGVVNYLNRSKPDVSPVHFALKDLIDSTSSKLWWPFDEGERVNLFILRVFQFFAFMFIDQPLRRDEFQIDMRRLLSENPSFRSGYVWTWPTSPNFGFRSTDAALEYLKKIDEFRRDWLIDKLQKQFEDGINIGGASTFEGSIGANFTDEERKALNLDSITLPGRDLKTNVNEITSSFEDFQRVIDEMKLLGDKFGASLIRCRNETTYYERFQSALATGSLNWTGKLEREFRDIQKDYERSLRQMMVSEKNLIEKRMQSSSNEDDFVQDVATELVKSGALNIEHRMKNLIKNIDKHCPPSEKIWPDFPFVLPQLEFKFTRDTIPTSMNEWLSKPLEKRQKPKAICEVILVNGGECPEFNVGDVIGSSDWQIKKIEHSGSRSASLQSAEIYVKRQAGVKGSFDQSLSDMFSKIPGVASAGRIPSADEIQQFYPNVQFALEPLAASYLQNINKCRLFIGIQKPSEDDEDENSPSSQGRQQIALGTGEEISLGQQLTNALSGVSLGLTNITTGISLILKGDIARGIATIISGIGETTYVVVVSLVYRLAIKPLLRWIWKHPIFSSFILTTSVVVAPTILMNVVGIGLGNIILPPGTSSSWFIATKIFDSLANMLQVAPSILSSIFYQLSTWMKWITSLTCGSGIPSTIVRAIIKWYALKDFIGGITKRSGVGKLATAAIWFYETLFGSVLDYLITFACESNVGEWINWAWNQTSSLTRLLGVNDPVSKITNVPKSFLVDGGKSMMPQSSMPRGITDFTEIDRNLERTILVTSDGNNFVKVATSKLDQNIYWTNEASTQQKEIASKVGDYLQLGHEIPEEFTRATRQGVLNWMDVDLQKSGFTQIIQSTTARSLDKINLNANKTNVGFMPTVTDGISSDKILSYGFRAASASGSSSSKITLDPLNAAELEYAMKRIKMPNVPKFQQNLEMLNNEMQSKGESYVGQATAFAQKILDYLSEGRKGIDQVEELLAKNEFLGLPISRGVGFMIEDPGFERAFTDLSVSLSQVSALPALTSPMLST